MKREQYSIIGIHINQYSVTCSWLDGSSSNRAISYKAIEIFRTNYVFFKDLKIFNMSLVSDYINLFVRRYDIGAAYATLCLAGVGFFEKIVGLSTQVPTHHALENNHDSFIWDYQLIAHNQQIGKSYYYISAIERSLLLQYQLLSFNLSLPIIALIPERAALLAASNYLLAYDNKNALITNHASLQNTIKFCIENYMPSDYVQQLPFVYHKENKLLLCAVGMLLNGMNVYEKY